MVNKTVEDQEFWKELSEIPGLEGFSGYYISSRGRLKSSRQKKEKIIKSYKRTGKGLTYIVKDLRCNLTGKIKKFSIHRLVLLAFKYIDNHQEMTVDHIDEDTFNNNLDNLQWLTLGENIRRSQAGSEKFSATEIDIITQEYLKDKSIRLQDLADKYNCSLTTIWWIINKYSNIPNTKRRSVFQDPKRTEIAEYYLNGSNLKQTAMHFNCSPSLVSLCVKEYRTKQADQSHHTSRD